MASKNYSYVLTKAAESDIDEALDYIGNTFVRFKVIIKAV